MTEPKELLDSYTATGSEDAFRELVGRYLDLVYSTALRLVNGDTHRAEDVTQTVFADLARLARGLSSEVMLGGWLHRRTWHVAAMLMHGERRRRKREIEAMEMKSLHDAPEPAFKEIAPILDEVVNQLPEADRTAIMLRFFERRDLRSIGLVLQTNEDAAQKRVSRALEKLRLLLVNRGVALSTVGLATALSAQAVIAAPAGMAASISAAALAGSALAGGGLALTIMKVIGMTKIQLAIGALVVAGVGTTLVVENQAQNRLRTQNTTLRQRMQSGFAQAPTSIPVTQANAGLRDEDYRELLRLRGEVNLLRAQQSEWSKARSENQRPRAVAGEVNDYPRDSLSFAGYGDPESAFRSCLWAATTRQDGKTILAGFSPEQQAEWLDLHETPEGVAAQVAQSFGGNNIEKVQSFRILSRKPQGEDVIFYTVYVEGLDVSFKQKMKKIGTEWKFDGEFVAD